MKDQIAVGAVRSNQTIRRSFKGLVALTGVLVVCSCALGFATALADDSSLTANAIAAKIIRTDAFTWDGARSKVRMVLTDASGTTQERTMDIMGRRNQGNFQSMVRFGSPQDIAGTAFLMLERGKDQSEQYIYLPGLKRTRRIAGREREGSFMGSDFSYADMQRVDDKYATHKRLPDEKIGNDTVFVIESTLNAEAPVSYSKIVTWIRKTDYVALRTKFYDRKAQLLKTLYSRRVKDIEGKPVVVESRMQNQQTNHITDLFIDSIERKDDLSDANFTPAALEHM